MPRCRVYSLEFKLAVAQRLVNGESVSDLHDELGIRRGVLYRWRDVFRKEGAAGLRLTGRPTGVEGAPRDGNTLESARRIAELERKIGQQDSRHDYAVYPNLVPRLNLTGIDQLWVADITYVRLREAFLYLAILLDAYSRKVVGWELGEDLRADLALGALNLQAPADPGVHWPIGTSSRASCITPTAACSTAVWPTLQNYKRTVLGSA